MSKFTQSWACPACEEPDAFTCTIEGKYGGELESDACGECGHDLTPIEQQRMIDDTREAAAEDYREHTGGW